MLDQVQLKIVEENPIGTGLDALRTSFNLLCDNRTLPCTQTPWLHNTNSFANSSEHRKYVDVVLKEELGPMYVGLSNFHETFLGGVADLETASKAVFEKCIEGRNPLYREGWSAWPKDANQDGVLDWFADLCEELAEFAGDHKPKATGRRPLAQPIFATTFVPRQP